MELKQLEYFTIVCEKGSFSQAAECLYTSQPNVSKVISSLEKELGRKLVERSSRGLRITPYGETVRDYAKVILKHASLISSMATHHNGKKFTLATYPSNMITNLLVDFYRHWGNGYIVEHQEGSVEEVSNWVASGQTEIGIVYIAQRQLAAFRHKPFPALSEELQKHLYFEFGSIEDHFKYRQAVIEAYPCGNYPVFEGYDHMQYQIRDPKGFAEMLAFIAEQDGMPKLPFIRK